MLSAHDQGLVLAVRAQPGARRNGIQGEQAGALKVAVSVAPEQGKANRAILDVLRKELDLKRSQLELLSGETSRDKRILIRGISQQELENRLAAFLG
jgi:uncharacterized protein (TIGR00251 family)